MKDLRPVRISFEFFPPKTVEGSDNLLQAAESLSHLSPDFFSVTFGAGGTTRDGTVDTVKALQLKTPIAVAPHISCMGYSKEELITSLHSYKALGVKRLVALRGDIPDGQEQTGEFRFASELVSLIRKETGDYFHIEVAAYPEVHPQAISAEADILNLKRKHDAGANSAITQYFFNPDAYFYYLDDCAKHNIDMPIIPGIMPIMQFSKLARFSDVCGAEIPRWIRKRLESYGDDMTSIHQFGIEVVYHLCQDLIASGVPGLHFYTLNKSETAMELIELLGLHVLEKRKRMGIVTGNTVLA